MPLYESLDSIQAQLATGSLSCIDLVKHYLSNISKYRDLNAFIEVFEDEALELAKEIDEKIASGKRGKLAGLVVGIKDMISYQGHSSTAASKILKGYESIYNSTAVQRLLDEDAIIIGRQNCDEFGMGSSSENSAYGPVKNGANPEYVAGGSSGGSAVAVQMGMCSVSLGTDTGGSVRQPAAFCGVIGLKPTYGRISRSGLLAYASSFDTIGIISDTIENNEKVLSVIAGKDEKDSTSSGNEYSSDATELSDPIRFCYYPELLTSGLNSKVSKAFTDLIEMLKSKGHIVDETSFPLQEYVLPTYYLLTMAEASSNLARYDGVRYGHRSEEGKTFNDLFSNSRSEGFGPEVKRRIMMGTFVLSEGYYDAYISKAQKMRALIKDHTSKVLSEYDFILSPTTPTTAFKLGVEHSNPVEMYLEDMFTVQASLAGIPAISIPFKEKFENLPIGLHISANEFNENSLYKAAKYILALD
ncbi:MAG: Asp-tRNA(Asn)/Glu-tRNA(Gln) amidotransferase subunit GatA [Bacteroidota bacterium]